MKNPYEWQPIETAPKDETTILVKRKDAYGWTTTTAFWSTDSDRWVLDCPGEYAEDYEFKNPSHWMPGP